MEWEVWKNVNLCETKTLKLVQQSRGLFRTRCLCEKKEMTVIVWNLHECPGKRELCGKTLLSGWCQHLIMRVLDPRWTSAGFDRCLPLSSGHVPSATQDPGFSDPEEMALVPPLGIGGDALWDPHVRVRILLTVGERRLGSPWAPCFPSSLGSAVKLLNR